MRAFLLVFFLVFSSGVMAQTAPPQQPIQQPPPRPYNGRMTEATVGVVEHKMGRLGFAANDPRYQATRGAVVGGIGTAATYVGTALIIGGVAAVSWPAVLVAAGVGAVVGGVMSVADGTFQDWLFNEDGTVTAIGAAPAYDPDLNPGYCWTWHSEEHRLCVATKQAVASKLTEWYHGDVIGNPGLGEIRYNPNTSSLEQYHTNVEQWFSIGTCCKQIEGAPEAGGGDPVTRVVSPMEALADLTESEASQPLSAEMMAAAANAMWRYAAQQDPNALPWSPSNPITVSDVNTWRAANPGLWPTVGDFAGAMAPPGSSAVPTPGGSPAPGIAPSPGGGEQVDLGPDPNVGAPALERIPTAEEILAPGFNLMPDLRNFQAPTNTGECPRPSFSVFDREYLIAAHCDLFEENRLALQLAMLALWSVLGIIIVLRA